MALDDNWYTEQWAEQGAAISLKLARKLHDEHSPYQHIEVYETEGFGRLLTLDGLVMLTDRDNFIYHEMLVHPALMTHPKPRRILIIGGGDCGTLREVLKHKEVERVEQVELDERVTRVAEEFFPALCEANHDTRAVFHFTDGIRWLQEAADNSYDVILVDSTDPVGPAAGLFSEEFYRHCHRALGTDGVLAAQSESPLFHAELIQDIHSKLGQAGFSHRACVHFPQCSYPSGWWSVSLGSKRQPTAAFRHLTDTQDGDAAPVTHYYHSALHAAALVMPRFLHQSLAG